MNQPRYLALMASEFSFRAACTAGRIGEALQTAAGLWRLICRILWLSFCQAQQDCLDIVQKARPVSIFVNPIDPH